MKFNIKETFKKLMNNKLIAWTIGCVVAFIVFALLSRIVEGLVFVSIMFLCASIILTGVLMQKRHKKTKLYLYEQLELEQVDLSQKQIKRILLQLKIQFIMFYILGIGVFVIAITELQKFIS